MDQKEEAMNLLRSVSAQDSATHEMLTGLVDQLDTLDTNSLATAIIGQ